MQEIVIEQKVEFEFRLSTPTKLQVQNRIRKDETTTRAIINLESRVGMLEAQMTTLIENFNFHTQLLQQ